jgi:hypothetical protein
MRRMLVGLALAFGSTVAIAGPPTPPTVSVEVVNAPLPVTTPQAVIPFAKFGAIKGLGCLLRRTTEPPTQWAESKTCLSDPPIVLSSPVLIWSLSFLPASAAYDIDPNTSCSAMYWLSIDNATTFVRIAQVTWTPGQFQSTVVPFPVPIELPANSTVVQQLDVTLSGGRINQGCNLSVRVNGATR